MIVIGAGVIGLELVCFFYCVYYKKFKLIYQTFNFRGVFGNV